MTGAKRKWEEPGAVVATRVRRLEASAARLIATMQEGAVKGHWDAVADAQRELAPILERLETIWRAAP